MCFMAPNTVFRGALMEDTSNAFGINVWSIHCNVYICNKFVRFSIEFLAQIRPGTIYYCSIISSLAGGLPASLCFYVAVTHRFGMWIDIDTDWDVDCSPWVMVVVKVTKWRCFSRWNCGSEILVTVSETNFQYLQEVFSVIKLIM